MLVTSRSSVWLGCLSLLTLSAGCGGSSSSGGGGSGSGGTTGGVGSGGSGPTTGSGGTTGGGSGGATGTGSGGTVATDGGAGGSAPTDGGPTTSCTFNNVMGIISPKISTVGVVTFDTTLAGATAAHVDFGLTTSYGLTAPVDLAAPGHRTLLLGMKPSKMYHYRITATGPAGSCSSGDFTVMTGAKRNGLPTITVTTNAADKLAGGFLVTGQYPGQAGGGYILDGDGEVVWGYNINSDATSARMSYDGKYMWISSDNCCDASGQSTVHRVSMDGMTDENLSAQFPGQNHQLTVLPDDSVAFYGYNAAAGCDDIKVRTPDGMTKTIVNSGKAQGVNGGCHVNTIQYSRKDDTLIFSDLDHSSYTKITRTGQTVWVLNGPGSMFGNNLWSKNHGLDVLDVDRILIFNNGDGSAGSLAIEWKLDVAAKTAMKVWTYAANPPIHVEIMGDVQRLPNGNTIVAYSTRGIVHEVAADGTLLQTLSWPLGTSFGFIEKRPTLYGPPPK